MIKNKETWKQGCTTVYRSASMASFLFKKSLTVFFTFDTILVRNGHFAVLPQLSE